MKKIALILLFFSTFLFGAQINKTVPGGLALEGYDTVAYFTLGKAVKGTSKYEFEYQGAKWRFSSKKHLELFQERPVVYMPQYGGYCAWAMAQNKKAEIDPERWKIVDQKLYLNYNRKIQKQWEAEIPAFIKAANLHWKALNSK